MQSHIAALIDDIAQLPFHWHGAGSVSIRALRTIAGYAEQIGPVRNTLETGSGKTTLLFSRLSPHHLVFSKDEGESLSLVKASPLFQAASTTFVEGATQTTLPGFPLPPALEIALIDGPHGYPFPDLEYYHLYPRIAPGGLLLVDDIRIPSIHRMFHILKAGTMFDLIDIVDNNLAFFQRTEAPLLDPCGDGWAMQGYNLLHARVKRTAAGQALMSLTNELAGYVPRFLRGLRPLKRKTGRGICTEDHREN